MGLWKGLNELILVKNSEQCLICKVHAIIVWDVINEKVPYRENPLPVQALRQQSQYTKSPNCDREKSELIFTMYMLGGKHALFYLIVTIIPTDQYYYSRLFCQPELKQPVA